MLLFGHVGITLGAAAVAARAVSRQKDKRTPSAPWFATLSRYADIRLLIIGSMLPDIIDKPVGWYFFRDTFNNGRIYAHTLLFLVLISAAGYFLYRRQKRRWLLTLAAGVLTHLAMDEMWQAPRTFFWPLLGLTFDKYYFTEWAANILKALMTTPYLYVSETIGLGVFIWFMEEIVSRKSIKLFLRHGKIV
jgi:inner membrane protein